MILYPKRLIFVTLLIIMVTSSFWLGSRYPALDEKAMMATSATVADTIAAFPILEVKSEYPFWKKTAYTTVNWVNDNKKGMTFGVILGGLFLTLISYLQFRQKSNKMLKTLYGFVLGTPLGVCVNCAAPVFKGVLQSRQAEMAFAMMLSSPTMNIVVLTMVFTLFPLYMAVTKTVFVLLVIFAGVPLLSSLLGDDHELKDLIQVEKDDVNLGQNCEIKHHEGYLEAFKGFARDVFKNISFIVVRTVPLMLVAGILGAIVSHGISLDSLMGDDGFVAVLIAAAVGLFLPVPVAFDVILVNALFSAGMSPNLALVLLCTLGIFSSYSFMITWQSASKQWATGLSAVILVLAVLVGLFGNQMHHIFYIKGNIQDYQVLRGGFEAAEAEAEIESSSTQNAEPVKWIEFAQLDGVTVKASSFQNKGDSIGKFKKFEGAALGLNYGFAYGIRDYPDPFWLGRGTASGDFNGDGWVDLAFGSDTGLKLYKNLGGRFALAANFPSTKTFRVYSVAFVDWNNDGRLDVFFTTFNRGNFVALNQDGDIKDELIKVPNGNGILTVSPSFGDFDRNGYLDVYNGNMALGIVTGFSAYGKGRRNSVTMNHSLEYKEQELDEFDGESMASLVSDFNGDGWLDIYVNNDFTVPDYLYFGQSGGGFQLEGSQQRAKRGGPIFSMSIDTADFNNDGKLDYVSSGTLNVANSLRKKPIIDGAPYENYAQHKHSAEWCHKIKQDYYRLRCLEDRQLSKTINLRQMPRLSVESCTKLSDKTRRDDCLLAVMWMIVTSNKASENCKQDFGFDPIIMEVCELHKSKKAAYKKNDIQGYMPQGNQPFLYFASKGDYKKVPFRHPGGWTWSMKAADLDNDGWQDIFNAEGAVRQGQFGFNVLMRNKEGRGFEQKQFSWNLVDDFGMFSFTFLDYDNDGDLDIIANSAIAPIRVFENRLNENKRVAFSIRSQSGNVFGIHSKITIITSNGDSQLREIKAGGGYQSFDAPVAYFGLGKGEAVRSVQIQRPGQPVVTLEKSFPAGAHYQIHLK